MNNLIYLIPAALLLGGIGLGAFLWSLRNGQYEDLDGAAMRILLDEPKVDETRPEAANSTRQGRGKRETAAQPRRR